MPKSHCMKSNFEGARVFPVFAKSAPFWIKFRLTWGLYLGRKGNFQTLGGQTLKKLFNKLFKHVSINSILKTCIFFTHICTSQSNSNVDFKKCTHKLVSPGSYGPFIPKYFTLQMFSKGEKILHYHIFHSSSEHETFE